MLINFHHDLADVLALVDANPDKLRGEMPDLQHAAAFLPRTTILSSVDFSSTVGSDLCIVTAGARQTSGESRLNLIHRNVELFQKIIPTATAKSPECILLIVSNPVDVLTFVAWKLSGFPPNRVIGRAYIIGEHGDSSVALWSSISVGGVALLSCLEKEEINYEKETLEKTHKAVVDSAHEVIDLKGYTSWAIDRLLGGEPARALLRDQRWIHPVSVMAKGLPKRRWVLGRVLGATNVHLTEEEAQRLRGSAETILEVQSQLDI
ncbi:hypothetical protein Scep_026902 [Stephania cephalantha]|uniref:L-lactate dehydrogenase n=1 Tax=Stephania cephalantha TaxID=152367 RepID=A0AAP0ERN6_9MAGN